MRKEYGSGTLPGTVESFRIGTLFVPYDGKPSLLIKVAVSEVIKTQTLIAQDSSEPLLYRLRICQDGPGSYAMSFTHTGQFQLIDYEEDELEIAASRIVKRT